MYDEHLAEHQDSATDDSCIGTRIEMCDNCGCTGLPERVAIGAHDCAEFLPDSEIEASRR
jgi:hypothetical protein